jgi:hypothetical protein
MHRRYSCNNNHFIISATARLYLALRSQRKKAEGQTGKKGRTRAKTKQKTQNIEETRKKKTKERRGETEQGEEEGLEEEKGQTFIPLVSSQRNRGGHEQRRKKATSPPVLHHVSVSLLPERKEHREHNKTQEQKLHRGEQVFCPCFFSKKQRRSCLTIVRHEHVKKGHSLAL